MIRGNILLLLSIIFICQSCRYNSRKPKDKIVGNYNEKKIIFSKKWSNSLGESYFIVTLEDNALPKDGENSYKLEVELRNSLKTIVIKDSIFDCPVEQDLNFIEKSFELTDIDNNGIKEASFAYNKYCRGDSPDSLNVYLIDRNNVFYIKGLRTNDMQQMIAEAQKKKYLGFGDIDKVNVSDVFQKYMSIKWYQYSHESKTYSKSRASKYFLTVKRKQIKHVNFIKQWQGSYGFGYGFRGDDVDYEMNFEISKEGSAYIINNDGTKEKAEIVRATKDSLELRDKENHQYILYRENGGSNYAIRGEAVYMLNPPNNDYPLTKSPLEKP
ncbi:MAG: hypothetical protein OIF50_09870 [Flavobacteriaceae bacterium]|nr:hypothetical protein [Flavobacteriaceae bacterium]